MSDNVRASPNNQQRGVTGKWQRVDPLLGQESRQDQDIAIPINCVQSTGIFVKAIVEGRKQNVLIGGDRGHGLVGKPPISPWSFKTMFFKNVG